MVEAIPNEPKAIGSKANSAKTTVNLVRYLQNEVLYILKINTVK